MAPICASGGGYGYSSSVASKRDYSLTNNSQGKWQDRMNTDEYNQSLERELRLRQQGKKRAAEIERKWRNEWLRGGGYDSYDGG